jgi:hypothetical protein
MSEPLKVQLRDVDDNAFWMQPPPNPDAAGEPIWVDLRLVLNKVGAVDTVAGTAFVETLAVFYWTDPRIIGWPEDTELPPRLWGPKLVLGNALGDLLEGDRGFMLHNPTIGRLK